MKIAKEFRWEMGHRLPEHFGLCKNIHGHCHSYVITDTENYKCVSLEQINYKPIKLSDLVQSFPPNEIKHIPKN